MDAKITETEAKTKWCPLVGQPRSTHPGEECIGSKCMAWRIVPAISENMRLAKVCFEGHRFIEAIKYWRAATGEGLKEAKEACEQIRDGERDWPPAEEKGYCSAFGRPWRNP